jgi:hypothetical protein
MPAGPDITDAQTPPPASIQDAAAARHERNLAILSELAEAGLEIAQALKTRIVETAAAEPDGESAPACADLTRAFDRASRAARLAIALQGRLEKEAAGPKICAVGAAPTTPLETRNHRAERIHRIVKRVAKIAYKDGPFYDAVERHTRERLFDPDIFGDIEGRPIGALVDRICADLGISPRWRAMAQEAWAQEEIAARPEGSPYAAWPDLPPDDVDPEDPDPDEDWEDEDDWDEPGGGGPGKPTP